MVCVSGKIILSARVLKRVLVDDGLGSFGLRDEKKAEKDKAHYAPISKGPSSKDKAPSLVKNDKGPLTMKCVFHVKPTFKWVKKARYGGPFFGFRRNCGMGLLSLESDHTNSALSSGLLEDTLQSLANIVPSVRVEQLVGNAPSLGVGDGCSPLTVEPLGRCTAQFCGSQVVLLAVVEDVERAAQPSPRDFVAVSELVGSPSAMENPSVLRVT